MITIISGTNRQNSNSSKIASVCYDLLSKNEKAAKYLSLTDLPLDFIDENMYGKKSKQFNDIVQKYISSSNKYIFVIAEYNGSFPGILKTFIDAVPPSELHGKRAALIGVSSGHAGALRPLDHFTDVLHHLKIEVLSNKPKLSNVDELINTKGEIGKDIQIRLAELIDQLIKF